MAELTRLALAIASEAHEGQVDESGRPYIEHPVRVALRAAESLGSTRSLDTEKIVAAALLHDAIEDTVDRPAAQQVTAAKLTARGIPQDVVTAVQLLTRPSRASEKAYYTRIAANPLALAVKLADIADNADPLRMRTLSRERAAFFTEKYANAMRLLEALTRRAR